MEMDHCSCSQKVQGHTEVITGMWFTPVCGSTDALIWIYSGHGIIECSDGRITVYQSCFLAIECKVSYKWLLASPPSACISVKIWSIEFEEMILTYGCWKERTNMRCFLYICIKTLVYICFIAAWIYSVWRHVKGLRVSIIQSQDNRLAVKSMPA